MVWPFRCKHPFSSLVPATGKVETKQQDEDFDVHTLRLHCGACGADVWMRWASCRGGVAAFLERGGRPSPMRDETYGCKDHQYGGDCSNCGE